MIIGRLARVAAPVTLGLVASAGCNLIDSRGIHIGYAFDPQHYTARVGDSKTSGNLPQVACGAGAPADPCAVVQMQLPAPSATMGQSFTVACEAQQCVATADVRLGQMIDLRNAQTSIPAEAVQFGVSAVAIDKITYWIASNTFNVATPAIDVFVAPNTAKDERDPAAVKLGSVASIPAMSSACADMPDPKGDSAAGGQKVCTIPLTSEGEKALSGYIQNFKTAPFQLIVHATIKAQGGTPIPSGALDFYVRPSVTLSILK